MGKIAGWSVINALILFVLSSGELCAAESRTPTPDEFRELVRKYNESGKYPDLQRARQVSRANEQFNRALALHSKKGATTRELKEAAGLYQAAADAGMPQAATNLALLHLEGKGVKKDVKKAVSLLEKASKMNDTQADVALARLYLLGTDVKRDEKKSELLLDRAIKGGNQHAVKMLAEYKEWKKKNDGVMKQYQELLKNAKTGQGKAGVSPAVTLPQPRGAAPSAATFLRPQPPELPLPAQPGYPFLGSVRANTNPAPALSSINILPAATPPISILPDNAGGSRPPVLPAGKQPSGQAPAAVPEQKKSP